MTTRDIPTLSESDKRRFRSKFNERGANECWIWTGSKNKSGYGTFQLIRRPFLASRIALHLSGIDVKNTQACHDCDTPACVNPKHLFRGTQADNVRDMMKKGRQNFQKHPERIAKGEGCGQAKLTAPEVEEIRSLQSSKKMSRPKMAEKFKVSKACIDATLSGRTWAHLLAI